MGGVERHMHHAFAEARQGRRLEVGTDTLLHRRADPIDAGFRAAILTRHRNDAQGIAQEPVLIEHSQGRPQHPHGQIAGPPDQNKHLLATR